MKTLKDCSTEPVDKDIQVLMLMMLIPEVNNYKADTPPEGLAIAIISKRLAKVNAPITEQCLMVLELLCEDKPAKAVMWAYTIFKLKIQTVASLMEHFQDGFPTEESQKAFWEGQKKDDGTNKLDDPWIWDNKHSTLHGIDRFIQQQDACINALKGH